MTGPQASAARAGLLALLLPCALAAQSPVSDSVVAARRADLAQFRSAVFVREKAYLPAARVEAAARLSRLEAEVGSLTAAGFELELADNGHSNVRPAPRSQRYNRIPVRLTPFGEEFRDCHGSVVRNPISVPTLAPDIVAPWTIEAYRAGRDPGMAAVVAALRPIQP